MFFCTRGSASINATSFLMNLQNIYIYISVTIQTLFYYLLFAASYHSSSRCTVLGGEGAFEDIYTISPCSPCTDRVQFINHASVLNSTSTELFAFHSSFTSSISFNAVASGSSHHQHSRVSSEANLSCLRYLH